MSVEFIKRFHCNKKLQATCKMKPQLRYILLIYSVLITRSEGSGKPGAAPSDSVIIQFSNSQGSRAFSCSSTDQISTACNGGENDKWYIIQSTASGLVADAADPANVKLQTLTGQASQLWKFQRIGKPGVYSVINKLTGTALEAPDATKIQVDVRTGSLKQQWILKVNGRLHNVGLGRVLNVPSARFVAGQALDTWQDTGHASQAFTVVQK